ncbi:Down syndrome cell adhesion molecule-like protein Dscam2 [Rhizophagus clarus]|uniref:Down syndrome cell adhesion molecule-like protein Dscam2 n=1 Tax=Rhizophagus clarus TaxID=94130 RepID=A0A8H3LNA2_9GLOM|nr:Down syndrome cell adhesion molecule-like protein Dscam2 [Rhizophagus clarus]
MANNKLLNSTEMTNKNTKVTRKTKTRKGKPQQFPNSPRNTQNNDASHIQDTNIRHSQQRQDELNINGGASVTNTFNLTFMGHNINGLGPDYFKLNIFMDYCTNKGADIIGICETNRTRKDGEFWNKQNTEYISFWTNKDNKIKGSGVCIIINKKWEKHLGKVNRIGAYYIEAKLFFKNCTLVVGVVKLNPKKRSFTWTNKTTSTRIDYIWADPKLEDKLKKSHIYQSADITDSDHNILLVEISLTDIIVTNNKGGRRAEKNTKRIIFDYENTTNEQWNKYEKHLKDLLEKRNAFNYIETHGQNKDTLNKLWNIICNCIQQASLEHIPHKKVGGTKTNLNRNYKEIEDSSKERKDLLYIRSLMRKLHKNELKGTELLKASEGIRSFNRRYETNISQLTEDTDWYTWKYTQEETLLNSKDEVQTEAINTFSALFCSRNHKFENLPEQWKDIYEPRADINPQIYDRLSDTPTEQEWNKMLNTTNDKSASGISNISYKLIKKAGVKVNELFRQYTGLCYYLQDIPVKWKVSQLYPIPKTYDWDYNLARTRPILLIECLRKCAVKIITKRLGSILSRYEILKGPNYAGLPGESTSAPLTIINGILEDAREENKTLWIVFQDMAKAFDSVRMIPLQKALERIRLPHTIINFIINIYKNRKMRIITAYGLTDTFTARDGIDQGEVISPLVWRIFYDPLLHRIQEDESLGYTMELKWPNNVFHNEKRNIKIQTATSVYVDDTQWIAKSKNKAKKISLIADEFFDINDIKINGEKSKIIVVNPEDINENERFLEIGKNKDKVFANKGSDPIRILGVWFKADKGDKHIESLVKKEISTILGAIRRKHITHAQAIYIVNAVLLPRLEYRLKTTIWEEKKYEEIFRPVMKVIKHKARLPANCHDNILLHSAQGKLKNLWRNQLAAQITEFLVALNSQTKQADILKIRLKKAQLTLNITSCILTNDPDVTVPNKILNNHTYNVVRKAHDYFFKFHPLTENEEWNIPIIGPSVRDFVYEQAPELVKKDKELIIRKAATLSIYGVLQLLNYDASNTITWQQICDFNKRQARGRTPKWFTILLGLIQQSTQLKDLCKISVESLNPGSESERDRETSINIQAIKECSDLACINRISNCQNNSNTKIIKDIIEIRNHQGRQHIPEWIPGPIQIHNYDTALIQNTLLNKESVTQHIALLYHLRLLFSPSDMINIYTDGSLTTQYNANLNTFTKHMGTGWVILNNKEEVILECSSSITEWPSSTRAELGAILSAILVLQTGQRVKIFTDSQAAIDSINYINTSLTNGKNKIRVWCKSNNYSIVSSIINLIDSKHLELKLIKVKGHSGVKGNEEADRVAKNDKEKLTCITINDSQQKDLKYDLYWDGKRVDRHIRKFIDNLCESALEAAWSLNRANRTILQDTTYTIEEKVTWALFKKNTGFNCTSSSVNNRFIKHLKLTNNLLPTLEIMKERRYDLYGDVKCRMCLEENEDDDHIIYCQQLKDKWLMVANNTRHECDQMLKDLLSQENHLQLNQEDIQQLMSWNRNFFVHITGPNQELPIPFIHLIDLH